jgi:hypothetical protein
MHCFACTDVIGQRSDRHFAGALFRFSIEILEVVQHKHLDRRWTLDRSRASPSAMAGHFAPRRTLASRHARARRRP